LKTITVLATFFATTILTALILAPVRWPLGFTLWVVIVVASLLIVVRWRARNTVYRCPKCGHLFRISVASDLTSPHGLGRDGSWTLLTCPNCGSYVKAHAF
jgi:uncharacterized C2H2 Zn-finger protein